jgi:hypothetical protein
VPDECDVEGTTSEDCDGDVVPDECQDTSADCNTNGVWDPCDISYGTSPDCNVNGYPDECDIAGGLSEDCTGNDIPDECESDCNGNGVADSCDIGSGISNDCNDNGVPDECIELEIDCNGNLVPDACDLAGGTSEDCNNNGIPDECIEQEVDCNDNLLPDACDVAEGTSGDCNFNDVPDECDIADGVSVDGESNGIPDECDAPVIFAWEVASAVGGDHLILDTDNDGIYGDLVLTSPIPPDGIDVRLEFYLLDWGPYLLGGYYVRLSWDVFSNGIGAELRLASDPDHGSVFIDENHPAFVLPFLPGMSCDPYPCTGSYPFPHWDGCVVCDFELPDPGRPGYGGTMMVHIPADAAGTYTIDFSAAPYEPFVLVENPDGGFHGRLLPVIRQPAHIVTTSDCNGNGVPDYEDIANATSEDCNNSRLPDECDIAGGVSEDCNTNETPDECDIEEGSSTDCQSNGVPDECESDSDGDGVMDDCDGCPDDPGKYEPGECGCGEAENDDDGDGVPACIDQCPGVDDAVFADECRGVIPTVSGWGMVVMALLALTTGKIVFPRRPAPPRFS